MSINAWYPHESFEDCVHEYLSFALKALYGEGDYQIYRFYTFTCVGSVPTEISSSFDRDTIEVLSQPDMYVFFNNKKKQTCRRFSVGVFMRYWAEGSRHEFRGILPFEYWKYIAPHIAHEQVCCDVDGKVCFIEWGPLREPGSFVKVIYDDGLGHEVRYTYSYTGNERSTIQL